jgi:hypothetical protein
MDYVLQMYNMSVLLTITRLTPYHLDHAEKSAEKINNNTMKIDIKIH